MVEKRAMGTWRHTVVPRVVPLGVTPQLWKGKGIETVMETARDPLVAPGRETPYVLVIAAAGYHVIIA